MSSITVHDQTSSGPQDISKPSSDSRPQTKTKTREGSEIITQTEIPEEVVLEGEELFMTLTPEEKESWEQMMKESESDLKNRKDKFEKWCDGISRRRMFAYSRLRKLQESFKQRASFYSDIKDYVATMEEKARRKSHPKVTVDDSSQINSES